MRRVLPLLLALPLLAQAPDARERQRQAVIDLYRQGAAPRRPAPRGPLMAEEQNTIRRFRESKRSVVFISTLVDQKQADGKMVRVPAGSGSGFVWDDSGHVVTCYHVVEVEQDGVLLEPDGPNLRVTLSDGKTYEASVIGRSLTYDIAVLQVFAPLESLKPLPIGTSRDLQEGQDVLAIGNPWGLDNSLTRGVISALNRDLPSGFKTSVGHIIQTDAPINPGNSGGPLLDSAGRVIGMNSAIPEIPSASGQDAFKGFVGIGFAVPIDTLNRVVPVLIRRGQFYRPRMGFSAVADADARRMGVPKGAVVDDEDPNGAAARAGLKPTVRDAQGRVQTMGDVIVGVEGKTVDSAAELMASLELENPRSEITLEVLREGAKVKVVVRPQGSEKSQ